MSTFRFHGLLLVVVAASAAFGQDVQLRPRQLPGWDVRAREGHCEIHVWVDNRAEVRLRGDQVFVKTVEGSPSRDEGSACSQPLPYNSVRDFQIRQTGGRNQVALAQQPERMNNYTALVNIVDPQNGGDSYTFDLSWHAEANVAAAPAPFFDDVRACQDLVRQRFSSQNGRGSYIDFDTFADRKVDNGRGQGKGRNRDQETIQGRGTARSRNDSKDITYSCVVDTEQGQVMTGTYSYAPDRDRQGQRPGLR